MGMGRGLSPPHLEPCKCIKIALLKSAFQQASLNVTHLLLGFIHHSSFYTEPPLPRAILLSLAMLLKFQRYKGHDAFPPKNAALVLKTPLSALSSFNS